MIEAYALKRQGSSDLLFTWTVSLLSTSHQSYSPPNVKYLQSYYFFLLLFVLLRDLYHDIVNCQEQTVRTQVRHDDGIRFEIGDDENTSTIETFPRNVLQYLTLLSLFDIAVRTSSKCSLLDVSRSIFDMNSIYCKSVSLLLKSLIICESRRSLNHCLVCFCLYLLRIDILPYSKILIFQK